MPVPAIKSLKFALLILIVLKYNFDENNLTAKTIKQHSFTA